MMSDCRSEKPVGEAFRLADLGTDEVITAKTGEVEQFWSEWKRERRKRNNYGGVDSRDG